jgi:hypothetical protein
VSLVATTASLPADLTSVREGRDLVRRTLESWGAERIVEDVELVASELIANALTHGLGLPVVLGPPGAGCACGADPAGAAPGGPIRISLAATGSHLICAVTDPSDAPPSRREQDPLTPSGRGLHLIEALSLRWGWTPLPGHPADHDGPSHPAGKAVWAMFPLVRQRQAVPAA